MNLIRKGKHFCENIIKSPKNLQDIKTHEIGRWMTYETPKTTLISSLND